MGVKSIKEHYQIKHFVTKRGENICIGSAYVHDIIVISPEGKLIKVWERNSSNADLRRYVEELENDSATGKLKAIFHKKDTFSKFLPVYTYENGRLIKTYCEEYGWPNVTHDGEMMYENTYFKTIREARESLRRDSYLGLRNRWNTYWDKVREKYKWLWRLLQAFWYFIQARIVFWPKK